MSRFIRTSVQVSIHVSAWFIHHQGSLCVEWASGNSDHTVQWETDITEDGVYYHKIWNQKQSLFGEWKDQAEWGNWVCRPQRLHIDWYADLCQYYATSAVNGTMYQTGSDESVRGLFTSTGSLNGSKDANFRAINDHWPVFGYATDFGKVGSKAQSSLFTLGLAQDEAVQFLGANGNRTLHSLWKSYFVDELSALSAFHNDYEASSKLSKELDAKIETDSKAVAGDNYALLTTLAARQVFGATQFVGSQDNFYLFLKEISSNGNTQTVDIIYPASPFFLYTNPELLSLLLKPHFENQESGWYPNKSAIHDLGAHYPNATGHMDGLDESMPLEECGNMIIMALAYAQRSGNTNYIREHYQLLKQWSEYLVEYSLIPALQLSTDDFAGKLENQTNLALKGIIGLEAMSQLSAMAGEEDDATNFTAIAHDYISRWMDLSINQAANPPHTVLTYNNMSTHGLLYNLYSDRLLHLDLVPQPIYDMQSAFYPTIADPYGIPLDSRNRYWTKSDWQIFCAAIASTQTRNMIIARMAKWLNETPTSRPFTDLYDTESGAYPGNIQFKARPVQGALFALLLVPQQQ